MIIPRDLFYELSVPAVASNQCYVGLCLCNFNLTSRLSSECRDTAL